MIRFEYPELLTPGSERQMKRDVANGGKRYTVNSVGKFGKAGSIGVLTSYQKTSYVGSR